jgi:hypothetical protein
MGFDYHRIQTIMFARNPRRYELFSGRVRDIEIIADRCKSFEEVYDAYNCSLVPPKSWEGHIEHERVPAAERPEKKPVAPLPTVK